MTNHEPENQFGSRIREFLTNSTSSNTPDTTHVVRSQHYFQQLAHEAEENAFE
ncbi:MAG: hypothetical protein GY758_33230 [Fuerstiella sp.]|nr:hypothetical protein [Fuerstiella sp.]MCP4511717.1 hypothetical protein [Fuerstiella sp.]MCP4787558.1 hypothetical protein [Fuerstiella sp.]MCP4858831.1 hypothetical protein [Fuerstiella sp.]